MSLLDALADVFSGTILPAIGTTVTLSSRATAQAYDTRGRLVDTSTQWGSATSYSAVVQPVDVMRDAAIIAQFRDIGISLEHSVKCYFRSAVAVAEGQKLAVGGKTYTVRFAQPTRKGYHMAIAVRAGGQQVNG